MYIYIYTHTYNFNLETFSPSTHISGNSFIPGFSCVFGITPLILPESLF